MNDLLELYPHLTRDDVRSTSMGAAGEDVQLSAAARLCIPFSFEAKNQERVSVWNAIEQARTNSPADATSVVVLKKNNEKPHVLLSWAAFKKLIGPCQNKISRADRELLTNMQTDLQRIVASAVDEEEEEEEEEEDCSSSAQEVHV